MKGRKGFTIIEMLVVITIILILTSLLAMFIKGTIERAKNAKTSTFIRLLDEGCHTYKVDYGVFPKPDGANSSRVLHQSLGSPRKIAAQHSDPPIWTNKGPIIEFKNDMLKGTGDPVTSPMPLVDAWDQELKYANPGKQNPMAVDIWSPGNDGSEMTDDDLNNWTKDY